MPAYLRTRTANHVPVCVCLFRHQHMLKMRRFGLEPVPPEILAMLPVTPPPHKDILGGFEPPLTVVCHHTVRPQGSSKPRVAVFHGAFISFNARVCQIPRHRTFVKMGGLEPPNPRFNPLLHTCYVTVSILGARAIPHVTIHTAPSPHEGDSAFVHTLFLFVFRRAA